MVNSMTGFAALTGEAEGYSWTWELKSVNARGLDIRLRMPDWLEGLDQPVRAALSKAVARGNITLGLRLTRTEGTHGDQLDPTALDSVLEQLKSVSTAADAKGIPLSQPTAMDVLAARGVLSAGSKDDDTKPLVAALLDQVPQLVIEFQATRSVEGTALFEVLNNQLWDIVYLTDQAAEIAQARKEQWNNRLRDNLAKVMSNTDGADPDRVAQELAVIIVKSDVTEEIDRLRAHVKAARQLLSETGAIGRKLDFLSQEFNREANTLCAKAQATDLTRVGLDLKAVIDQMREQVQNVE